MITKKIGYLTGSSNFGISEAIQNALQEAEEHSHFEVVETSSTHFNQNHRHYQVTLSLFGE